MTEKDIKIQPGFITLGQFLKKVDEISSGGEARAFLDQVEVKVNGAVEARRGRKLTAGDTVEIRDTRYHLKVD